MALRRVDNRDLATNSRIKPEGSAAALVWAVEKITDSASNAMLFTRIARAHLAESRLQDVASFLGSAKTLD